MTYEIIPVEVNTPKWLELRREGIGGSDAGAALGLSKWRTPYQVYLDKIGETQGIEENESMYWGKKHEDNIINRYIEGTGKAVERPQAIFRNQINPFMQYTPDGISFGRLLEAKTSRYGQDFGDAGTDEIPQEYLVQVQHGMIVTGLRVCDVAVLISGSEYRQYEIPADKELQEMIIEQESAFWEKVQKRIEPEPITTEDLKRRYPFSRQQSIECDDYILNELEELIITRGLIEGHEADEIRMSNIIKRFIGDNDTLEYLGKTLASWKSTKPGEKFDVDTFKQVYPDIYKKYLIKTDSQRRFLIK